MSIAKNLTDLIGNTPMLELAKFGERHGLYAKIFAKLEYFNPLGSVKDRVGIAMLADAEKRGLLTPDSVIIEPTSGNTGIGLAFAAAERGYKLILTMPETMSTERRNLLAALGANLILTDGSKGMSGAVEKARELAAGTPNSFIPAQFDNPANPQIHRETTALEIWRDCNGKVDIFVSAVGTGGTITGVGEVLKEKNPAIKIIAVEPFTFPHKIQGTGAGFTPTVFNEGTVDEFVKVRDDEALQTTRELARTQGLLVGISSGAAVYAAQTVSAREENRGKSVVVILADSGERYLSAGVF
jgi:cysteine synthase A